MRRLPLDTITALQEDSWRELAAEAIEPNVFFEPEYVLAAARAFDAGSDVALLVDESDGRWNGCLPVYEKRLLGRPTIVSAWKHLYSFLGTPLVRAERADAFAGALMRSIRTRQTGLLLSLRNVSEGPVLEAILGAREEAGDVSIVRAESARRAALEVGGGLESPDGLSKKRRKELERLRRRLAEKLAVAEIAARHRTDHAKAVDDFLRLEGAGWKGESGTALTSNDRWEAFFRSICRFLAAEDRLVFRSLEADGRIAAMTCDFAAGDVLFGFKSAFDEDLKAYSPGVLLQVDNLVATGTEARYKLFDSCGDPANKMLNSVWPDRRGICSLVLARQDLLGRAAGRALTARGALPDRRA